jgi:glycosyltransferase involved in cell wall biosynthesis
MHSTIQEGGGIAMPPLRIAFAVSHAHIGGVARMTVRLAGEIIRRGHDTRLYVPGADNGPGLTGRDRRLRVVPLAPGSAVRAWLLALRAVSGDLSVLLPYLAPGRRLSETFAYLPSLAEALRRDPPDVLVSATPYLNVEAVWACQIADVPTRLVLTERAARSPMLKRTKHAHRRRIPAVMRRTYPRADAVVAVSDGVADDLAMLTGLRREGIRTIFNPTFPEDLDARLAAPWEHPFFAEGQPPVVVTVGRLTPQKAHPDLLRAFARARSRRAMRLVIVGGNRTPKVEAARMARLKALARDLGIERDVDLLGFLANPFPAMARARLFVLPSEFEGFPNVLVEALACGTPVVATDCPGGSAEILGGGRFGRLVPVGDEEGLAEAMLAGLDEPREPDRLRARAAEFNVARAADAYLDLFREILTRPAAIA